VFTDPLASPTGFPFKVVQLDGTLSDEPKYTRRRRICDLAYLRQAYKLPDGKLGWRCAAEPEDDYVRKGGKLEDTVGRKCVCNALAANIGIGQLRADDQVELPLLTSGEDVANVARFLSNGATSYTAADVIDHLLSGVAATHAEVGAAE